MGELIEARQRARELVERADEIIERKCNAQNMSFDELATPQNLEHIDSDRLVVSAIRLAELLQRLG